MRINQPLADAKILLPQALFLPSDAVSDREALRQLAIDAHRFSPLVGLEEGPFPESLLSDVTGCTHLWNGEEEYLQSVRDYWLSRDYHIQLALAGTLGTAWALARAVSAAVVAEGDEVAALAGLPVTLLRLPSTILERLEMLGLRTIRDVLQLPRETLISRFEAILPQRLDQTLGRRPETFTIERVREPLTVVREWEVPLDDRLTVALICREMLQQLLSIIDRTCDGVQELEGELRTEAGAVNLQIKLVEPSRDERHLVHVVELQLERCTWREGVIAIRWTVSRLGRLTRVQHDWLADGIEKNSSQQVVGLIDILSSRLGDHSVVRVEALPESQPELAIRHIPWTNIRPNETSEFSISPEESRCRPFRLLSVPQRIAVKTSLPDGTPIHIAWRNREYDVVRCWGPERIETGWWRATDIQRDYYRTEWKDGTHAWIFRDHMCGHWFLHGFFE